jgi:hypothetical protein
MGAEDAASPAVRCTVCNADLRTCIDRTRSASGLSAHTRVQKRTAQLRGMRTRAGGCGDIEELQRAVLAHDRCVSLKVRTPFHMRGAQLRSGEADAAHRHGRDSNRRGAPQPQG